MRRFLTLALAVGMLAGPTAAFAEFSMPADLLNMVEAEMRPQSFSVTAKGHVDQTWFAIWANGSAEGVNSDMTTGKMKVKMTVDVVQGDMKVRAKGQLMVHDGTMYLKLDSIDGGYNDAFMSFSALFGQKMWLQMPVDSSMMEMHSNMTGMDDDQDPNQMFSMTHTKFGAGHKYVLTLRPDYTQQFSDMMREAMGNQSVGTSDDFFPFRDLAYDNADFTVKIDTNANDEFQFSSFDMHWKAGNAELTMTGTSKRQATPVYVETPKNTWTMEDLERHYNELMGMSMMDDDMMPEDEMMMPPADAGNEWWPEMEEEGMTDGTFDSIDENSDEESEEWWEPASTDNADCWDPELTPLKKLALQRTGQCPSDDFNNRTFRR